LGESINKYKIDNIKLSLELNSLEQQIEEFRKNAQNPQKVQSENLRLRQEIAEMEKMLAGIRSSNIQLESQSTLTRETQNVQVYSNQEIGVLEKQVQDMEKKNS
jgi:hypothetical protein